MPGDPSGDLGVDVLIIGGSIQAAYLAASLHPEFSVCVLDDPTLGHESLVDEGYLSAGYEGNDVNRVQPARRAMSFWDHWTRIHGLRGEGDEAWCIIPAGDEQLRTETWRSAGLPFEPAAVLPEALSTGALARHRGFRIPMDRVVDTAAMLRTLREPILDRYIEGRLLRFVMFGDDDIDSVEIEVGSDRVLIVPRFVVAACDAGNAEVIRQLSARFSDAERRRSATKAIATCQAVRTRDVIAIRGDLPLINGWFDRLHIVSHPLRNEVVWLVSPPTDLARTKVGPVDLRFAPPIDSVLVGVVVERLLAVAPAIAERVEELRWAAWARRLTQHPMVADATVEVGTPVPAKLEALDMNCFLALWPSHLAYTMILGDVAAERIGQALGASAEFSETIQPTDLGAPVEARPVSHWASNDVDWHDWEIFAERFDVKSDR